MHEERELALIDADHRRLVRAVTRLLGPADAEDAVQDAYVRALEANALELDAVQAWLLTVARHLAIDNLRRRNWMARWLAEVSVAEPGDTSPSVETKAALAQEVARALRLLAARLPSADGAALLLHEVFDIGHAEIARASGRSEPASRQHLRRALSRIRLPNAAPKTGQRQEVEPSEEAVFRVYLQSLQWRNPQALWAMLRQPPVSAVMGMIQVEAGAATTLPPTSCSVLQVGGQLGLALTLDGIRLCVLPLGVRPARDVATTQI